MADIDNLEIQISSDSSDAAQSISALVSSLGKLESASVKAASGLERLSQALNSLKSLTINTGIQGSLSSLENAVSAIPKISNTLRGAKINESAFANIEKLGQAIASLDGISVPEQFIRATQTITSATEQLGALDIGTALSNLYRLSPALEKLSGALSGMSTAQTQFQNMTSAMTKFAGGVAQLSIVDIGIAENIRQFMDRLLSIEIKDDFVTRLDTLSKAIQKVTNAKPNESAADALRLLIDTVRLITDEDIARLRELSAMLDGLKVIRMPRIVEIHNPVDKGAKDAVDEFADTVDDAGRAAVDAVPLYEQFGKAISSIGHGALKAVSIELKALTAPIRAVGNAFSKAADKVSTFLASVKRILFYRAIRSMLKAIAQGFQEGRENLYQYSLLVGTEFARSMDRAATSFLYLKNSIAAASAPLTNYLVPVLEHIIDTVVELVNKFNELTAALTGAATWTKALKYPVKWQEAADDANKSAKALKSTILGFDELNVIEPKKSSKGGSGKEAYDYSKMFTEVKTNWDKESGVSEFIIPIKLAWDNEGKNTIKTIKNAFGDILGLVGAIGDSFYDVWTNGTGQKTLETMLQIVQNIAGAFGGIASGMKKAWIEGGKGTKIIQNLWNTGNNVLTVFNDIWHSIRNWAEGLNWNPLFSGFEKLSGTLSKLTDPNGGLAKISTAVVDKFLLPIGKVLIEDALPAAVDLLSEAFDELSEAAKELAPYLETIFDWLGKIATGAIDALSATFVGISGISQTMRGEEISNSTADLAARISKNFEKTFGDAYKKWENLWGGVAYTQWFPDRANGVEDTTHSKIMGMNSLNYGWNDNTRAVEPRTIGGKSVKDFLAQSETSAEYYYNNRYAGTKSKTNVKGAYGDRFAESAESLTEAADTIDEAHRKWGVLADDFEMFKGIGQQLSGLVGESKPNPAYIASDSGKKSDWYANYYGSSAQTTKKQGSDEPEYINKSLPFLGYTQSSFGETDISGGGLPSDFVDNWTSGMDTITDSLSSFSKNWKSGWNDIGDWTSKKWDKITSAFSTGWQGVKTFMSNFGTNWKSGWEDVRKWGVEKWDAVKQHLGTGWETLKGKVSDWRDNWSLGMKDVKETIFDKWNAAKDKLQEGWTDIRSKLFTWKEEWKSGMKDIGERVREKWDAAKSKLLEGWSDFNSKLDKWKQNWLTGLATIKSEAHDKWDNIKAHLESGWKTIKDKVTDYFEAWTEGFKDLKKWYQDSTIGKKISNTWDTVKTALKSFIPSFATGGTIDSGQLFIAREAGAELVGNIGNTTAVMNNQQIVQAVSSGVAQAVSGVMAQMLAVQGNNSGNGEIAVSVYLDGRQIAASVEKAQKRKGVSILGGVNYAT